MKTTFKTIGIIGGMGSLATAALFTKVLNLSGASSDAEYPRIFIDNNTTVPDRSEALLGRGESPVPALLNSAETLAHAGAQVLGMPCNTAHAFLPYIEASLRVPLVNMVSETVDAVALRYPSARVGILCTTGTRFSGIYDAALKAKALVPVNPNDGEQENVMRAIYGAEGIKAGNITKAREILLPVCEKLIASGADVIVLACTELSLAVTPEVVNVPLVDTSDILAAALIREARILI
ncbi:amino acid racemase [Candidatus Kaiserbacteria bacterium]|nr:amino acid racemase [Candidatus Kaiserbacteria bacterium]